MSDIKIDNGKEYLSPSHFHLTLIVFKSSLPLYVPNLKSVVIYISDLLIFMY